MTTSATERLGMMRNRIVTWLAAGLVGALTIAGCGGHDDVSPEPDAGDAGWNDAGPDDAGPDDASLADAHVESDAGPEPECATADDCALGGSVCGVATCFDGECGVAPAPSGIECRAPLGVCDVAEVCDGVSLDCPADALVPADTECRAPAGACDVADVCDGESAECPADAVVAAGTECRASLGVCDAAEVCDGESAECAADTVAEACAPPIPFTHSARGRNLTATIVDLNDTGTPVATVSPRQRVSLRVAGELVNTGTDCPGCFTQFYARMDDVFTLCLVHTSTLEDVTFDQRRMFTAPSTPGVYFVQIESSWELYCLDATDAPTEFGPRTMATLIVR